MFSRSLLILSVLLSTHLLAEETIISTTGSSGHEFRLVDSVRLVDSLSWDVLEHRVRSVKEVVNWVSRGHFVGKDGFKINGVHFSPGKESRTCAYEMSISLDPGNGKTNDELLNFSRAAKAAISNHLCIQTLECVIIDSEVYIFDAHLADNLKNLSPERTIVKNISEYNVAGVKTVEMAPVDLSVIVRSDFGILLRTFPSMALSDNVSEVVIMLSMEPNGSHRWVSVRSEDGGKMGELKNRP